MQRLDGDKGRVTRQKGHWCRDTLNRIISTNEVAILCGQLTVKLVLQQTKRSEALSFLCYVNFERGILEGSTLELALQQTKRS